MGHAPDVLRRLWRRDTGALPQTPEYFWQDDA